MNPALGVRGIRAEPRPPGAVRDAAPRAPRGDARRAALDPAADGLDGRGGGRGPRRRSTRAAAASARRGRRRGRRRPRRRDDRDPVGGGDGRRLRPGRRLLQHRDERPRPVHARRRPDERVAGGARHAAPAGGAPPGPLRRRGRRGSTAGTSRSAARRPPIRLAAALFVGLGVDELSVAPSSIAGVRGALGRLDARSRAGMRRNARARRRRVAEVRAIAEALVAGGRRSEARRPADRSASSAAAGGVGRRRVVAAWRSGSCRRSRLTSLRKSLMLRPSADPSFGRFFGPCQISTITRTMTTTMRTSEPMRGWYSLVSRAAGRRPG